MAIAEGNIIDLSGDGGVVKEILKKAPEDAGMPEEGNEIRGMVLGQSNAKNDDVNHWMSHVAHYVGTMEDGSVFDSSRERNKEFTFVLGRGSVIKGWDIGFASMKKGEVRSWFFVDTDDDWLTLS